MVVIVLGFVELATQFYFWIKNYKKAVSPFPVIKAKQSKHYFNLSCVSGSQLLHHFTGLTLALPSVERLYFFFSYICFSSNSLKFLHFCLTFIFLCDFFLCSIVFVDLYRLAVSSHFCFYSLFKIYAIYIYLAFLFLF